MQLQLLHAASRLPDISVVITYDKAHDPSTTCANPAMRPSKDSVAHSKRDMPAFCIDLDVDYYPDVMRTLPDPYAIQRIGLKNYYEAYQKLILSKGLHQKSSGSRPGNATWPNV